MNKKSPKLEDYNKVVKKVKENDGKYNKKELFNQMNEKSPSVIKGHACAFCDGEARFHHNYWTCINHANFDGVMGIRKQTLADVEKIIDKHKSCLGYEEFCVDDIKEEIKNLKSQGTKPNRTDVTDTSQDVFRGGNASTELDKTPDNHNLKEVGE